MQYFFSQLTRSIGIFFRTIRAFISRKLMGLASLFRRLTNFSRHAPKIATTSVQEVVSAAQKPTSAADYVETGRLFISKALILRVILVLAAIGVIGYFLVWPFVLSHFLTAKFYEEDKRVSDWSGRVIVYSDKKKTTPLYAGRLEDGKLQGDGKLYDRAGVLLYEGQLKDGLRNGSGKEYESAVLVYDGQFADDMRSGYGKSYARGQCNYEGQFVEGKRSGNGAAYENGRKKYDGQFAEDLYEGPGKLYTDGRLRYDGMFHAGAADGTGVAYYASGKTAYQGEFQAGKRSGTGTAFDEDGRKVYEGGFAADEYSGDGILYFEDGSLLEASFENGAPVGSVSWKKDGLLYYQGQWSDDMPSGFGTLYNRAGKKLYEGPFAGGTIDGNALLDYATDDIRDVLADGSVKNETDGAAFRILAEDLGLTILCTYQTEGADSLIYQIYLSAPEKDGWVALLPGMPHTAPVQLPGEMVTQAMPVQFIGQMGGSVPAGPYAAENSLAGDRRITVLYDSPAREQALLVTWFREDITPSPLDSGKKTGKQMKTDNLLLALDKMVDSEGTATSTGVYLGGEATADAFADIEELSQAADLADVMLDYWNATQRQGALEEAYNRGKTLLDDAVTAAAKGLGSQDATDALQQQQLEWEAQIDECKIAIKRASLQAADLGVDDLSVYTLEEMLVSFDPGEQEVDSLVLIAVAYAQASGSDADPATVESNVKMGLLDLEDAHNAVKLAMSRYESLTDAAKELAGAYAMGLDSKENWYQAMSAQSLARADLCTAMADFSKQANHFNLLTGGWVTRTFDWNTDVFEPLLKEAAGVPEEDEKTEDAEPESGESAAAPPAVDAEPPKETPEETPEEETPDGKTPEGAHRDPAEKPENTEESGADIGDARVRKE